MLTEVQRRRSVPEADLGNYQATHLRFCTPMRVLAVSDADENWSESAEVVWVRTAYWR
jgi:hypothetical protein